MNFEFLNKTWFTMGAANIWTHQWIQYLPIPFDSFLRALSVSQLVLLPFLFFFSRRRIVRFVIFLLLFFTTATEFNRTQTHAVHFLLWSFVPFVFCEFSEKGLNRALVFSQLQVLLLYFLSGFWKVSGALLNWGNPKTASLAEFMNYSIAQEFVNSNKLGVLAKIILEISWLSGVMGFFAMSVQVMSLVGLAFPKFRWVFGLLALSFHLLTYLIFRIYFQWAFWIILVVLILPEFLEWMSRQSFFKKMRQDLARREISTPIKGI